MALLNTQIYKELKSDPTARIERKVCSKLSDLKKSNKLSQKVYDHLRPYVTVCHKFYGLPKIHKPDVPLRPIVASQGSPTYNLAKYLAEILKPLVGKSEHHVVNYKEYISKIEQTKLDEDEILVSFDVVSLFTNVPVDEVCTIAKERLLLDNTLHLRITLSRENIYVLLKLCLSTTWFQLREKFYEQIHGAPMGSPLSPVMANLFMEEFEKKLKL